MRRFLDNIGWKLLSVAIAVVLWIVVVGEPQRLLQAMPSQIRDLFANGHYAPDSPVVPAGVR
jgi:hypothetical protein